MKPETFHNVRVVGMYHRGQHAKDIAAALTPGDGLLYEREPDNPFDNYAIKVLFEADGPPIHIGYIEAKQAAWIAPWMDDGWTFTVTVTGQEHAKNNIYPLVTLEPITSADVETEVAAEA